MLDGGIFSSGPKLRSMHAVQKQDVYVGKTCLFRHFREVDIGTDDPRGKIVTIRYSLVGGDLGS